MPEFQVTIFAADNITNPQNPGFLPAEDTTFLSDLNIGDQLTWVGGGESTVVTITDNVNTTFDEAQSNQTLTDPVTFDGISYGAGQVVTPTYTIVFSGSDGNTYTMTSFNFSGNTNNEVPDAAFWEGNIPPPGTVLTLTNEINPTAANSRDYNDMAVCFTTGVRLLTPTGERTVETLKVGDLVNTADGTASHIRWIGSRDVGGVELRAKPNLLPVRITSGALGNGLPVGDLVVSPQHRLMVVSKIAQRMFGKHSVLVAAKALVGLPGIDIDTNTQSIRYYHILLDSHEILCANGAPAESLYLGTEALKAMSQESMKELRTLFPAIRRSDFRAPTPHTVPRSKHQKRLVERHSKNRKPLLAYG